MAAPQSGIARDYAGLADAELVDAARHGEREAFRHIMLRCNQRLFRMARGVLNDDAEAEDAVQEAYVDAFERLDGFRGESSLLTWLTRIVLNEAYGRLRQVRPTAPLAELDTVASSGRVIPLRAEFGMEDPAAAASRDQVRRLVERAIEELPEPFRIVFVMREIEDCSVEETAQGLGLKPETVKTRLHRARRLLRARLSEALSSTLTEAFPFLGVRCERMTRHVLQRLPEAPAP